MLNFRFLLEWNANCKSSFSALHDEVVMSHCIIMKDVESWSDLWWLVFVFQRNVL